MPIAIPADSRGFPRAPVARSPRLRGCARTGWRILVTAHRRRATKAPRLDRDRQRDAEGRSPTFGAGELDPPLVPLVDHEDGGQAQARPLALGLGRHERLE